MHINLLRTSTRRGNAHTHEVNRVSLRLPAPQTPQTPHLSTGYPQPRCLFPRAPASSNYTNSKWNSSDCTISFMSSPGSRWTASGFAGI